MGLARRSPSAYASLGWAMDLFEREGVSATQVYERGQQAGTTSTSVIVKPALGL